MLKAVEALQEGRVHEFCPRGNSMAGRINSGQKVQVSPITGPIKKDDIVLCKVNGRIYLHIVKAISGNRYLIGNNHGGTNGWTPADKIYGVVTKIYE